ncbi:hypothetical protein [Clostridium phage Amboise]|nr:hypothetical protein [Clostridium phage Amboise]DAH78964.1 MAG TPA: hypothetical protein [Caudoviricetes sp.]
MWKSYKIDKIPFSLLLEYGGSNIFNYIRLKTVLFLF